MEDRWSSYVEAMIKEFQMKKELLSQYIIKSIFIGGGTPSLLPITQMKKILDYININLKMKKDLEFTIESNPGTLDREKLEFYLESGINRISMGFQAWQDHILREIGRIHTKDDFVQNFKLAREVGFKNINVDLMFGLPNQTIEEWRETLENIVKLNPEHISSYSLKIEDNTIFARKYDKGLLKLPSEEEDRKMYYLAKDILTKNNYIHYEISNFSKNTYESVHNMIYWKNHEYIGVGLGAHSYINKTRTSNLIDMNEYIKNLNIGNEIHIVEEVNSMKSHISECMFLGLRLVKGINIHELNEKYKVDIEKIYEKQMKKLIGEKLLKKEGKYLFLTPKGIDLSNQVFMEFLIE
jgi:oxygen-independent coproporphyrinogen-3 oxidase